MAVLMLDADYTRGNRVFEAIRDQDLSLYWVTSPREAEEALFEEDFHVVVVNLAFMEGTIARVDFICGLRRRSPISSFIAITNRHRDAVALDGCVEVVLAEPLDVGKLVECIRRMTDHPPGALGRHAALVGGLYVNFAFQVVELDGIEVPLTRREFAILRTLADRPGAVVERQSLLESVFDAVNGLESNSLEVHIHNLRSKIGKSRIATIRGRGYRLDAPD